jgi:hypothetical protein
VGELATRGHTQSKPDGSSLYALAEVSACGHTDSETYRIAFLALAEVSARRHTQSETQSFFFPSRRAHKCLNGLQRYLA